MCMKKHYQRSHVKLLRVLLMLWRWIDIICQSQSLISLTTMIDVRYNLVSKRCVLLDYIVLHRAHDFYSVVIFFIKVLWFHWVVLFLKKKLKWWGFQPWAIISINSWCNLPNRCHGYGETYIQSWEQKKEQSRTHHPHKIPWCYQAHCLSLKTLHLEMVYVTKSLPQHFLCLWHIGLEIEFLHQFHPTTLSPIQISLTSQQIPQWLMINSNLKFNA